MFRPQDTFRDPSGHDFLRRKFHVVGRGSQVSLDTIFSIGWSEEPPVAVAFGADRSLGDASLQLAVNAESAEYRILLSSAKQETPKSATRTLERLHTAQQEEGAGLEESLAVFCERHMARLAMAHIVQQRGFTLADSSLIGLFVRVASIHQPSAEALNHPAFQRDVFNAPPL